MSDFHSVLNFDCAASAPVLPCVWAALLSAPRGNPNAAHAIGREARAALEKARADIAECIGAEPEEILFTPSATAACRFAVEFFDITLQNPNDHKAVFDAVARQNRRHVLDGDIPSYSPFISIPYASNETGELFVGKIENIQKYGDDDVFTDATAAIGHCRVDVKELGVAALAAGAHKFGGFAGVGFLYVKNGFADRGIAERDHTFPGTPPVVLAVAMAAALKYRTEHMGESEELFHRRTAFVELLRQSVPGMEVNTPFLSVPTILSVRFDGVNARELLTAMEMRGLCASAGAACSSGSDEPSRQLLAAGLTQEQALSTVRFSFTEQTSMEAFQTAASIVSESVAALRSSL